MRRDGLTTLFGTILRIGTLLNYACGLFFVSLLIAEPFVADRIDARLVAKYGAGLDTAAVIGTVQIMLLGGVIGVAVVARLFTSLRAMLASITGGEPFAIANAGHLRTIDWMLLVLQLIDVVSGVLTWRLVRLGVETYDWSPSVTGWIAVLVAFILARVFSAGAAMQDDLRGTV